MTDGKIISINISKTKGVKKIPQDKGVFIENFGLKDDAHAGNWHRQVSLLAIESINKMENENIKFKPGDFAENLTTEGIKLYDFPLGTKFEIGECLLEITQIGKKCHDGCEIKKMTGYCIMPKEGIFAKVLRGGLIKSDDFIKVLV
ncbi:MOSC domain-containing protein [Anaerococcus sp. AGMB00486]|uniref:MOSC domain-containing protein n=2 Tax=Anaerococcus TaxID=165779 RepID=A0ABX2NA91_9FIRM|nr:MULTISPECIES: MOSC domain-containing protein [Anaerococcus]MSS77766.1 MOSC domain-containing protein [Anaerococcus porci]NVF11621.1 MOSC domain-containing protein [Anaerococcus faecalis]